MTDSTNSFRSLYSVITIAELAVLRDGRIIPDGPECGKSTVYEPRGIMTQQKSLTLAKL